MPKRATHTYESEKDGLQDQQLNVYFCMCCGESALILGDGGAALTTLPRRKTDGAYVLDSGETVFKLHASAGETKVIRREKGYERQHRLNCWSCGVFVAYTSSEAAPVTYVLPDALGAQADLYLQLYQVPPCIQSTGPQGVRVAMEVSAGQPKKAITCVNNAEVGISVCAQTKDGLANAEMLELMAKVLGATRQQLQLSRGWSQKSKFLMVTGMTAVEVFKKLRANVETDLLPVSAPQQKQLAGLGDDIGPAATAGIASSVARKQWEDGEELEELAAPPTMKQQVFRN